MDCGDDKRGRKEHDFPPLKYHATMKYNERSVCQIESEQRQSIREPAISRKGIKYLSNVSIQRASDVPR
jgi:hypothetical protein